MAVVENYVKLEKGKPILLHFIDHGEIPKIIKDPILHWKKTVKSLIFKVDRVDGEPADTIFSILSEKLWNTFKPYLEGKRYLHYEFLIVKDGVASAPPRIVEIRPYKK